MRGPESLTLEYRSPHGAPPRRAWATRLGVFSTVFGVIGAVGGLARSREAWTYAFDPTFRWLYPPPPWVDRAYFFAIAASPPVSALLMTAGIITLLRPSAGLRAHRWYVALKIPLVIWTSVLHAWQMWPHPYVSWQQSALQAVFECLFFGAYAWIVLLFLRRRRRYRPHRHDDTAGPAGHRPPA